MTAGQTTPNSTLPADVRQGVFVVVPAYNEGRCIEQVVSEVRAMYPNVVVVDDGSTDNTLEAARRCATYVLRHLINRGQGATLQTGIQLALLSGARYVVTFDADGQHQVEDIQPMLEPIWRGECEITLGSRFLGQAVNVPASRRATLRLGVLFSQLAHGVKLTDVHNGLRAFSRRAAENIQITLDRMAHASELIDIIVRSGLAFREVPVQVRYTDYSMAKGQSSLGAFRIAFQYLLGRVLP